MVLTLLCRVKQSLSVSCEPGPDLHAPEIKAKVCALLGVTDSTLPSYCWQYEVLARRTLSDSFCLFLTVALFQSLPFEARLNTSMGPGRTVVIKGEVNTNAKGSVLLPSRCLRIWVCGRSCCAFLKGGTQCKVPSKSYWQSQD